MALAEVGARLIRTDSLDSTGKVGHSRAVICPRTLFKRTALTREICRKSFCNAKPGMQIARLNSGGMKHAFNKKHNQECPDNVSETI